MYSFRILLPAALLGAVALAQPSITSVENAASNIPQGLPNSGIAQGAMFVVKGARLGPPAIVIDDRFPLETTLAGTSIKVTSQGQVRDAIIYYTLDRQVAAILPSSLPAGTGTMTVTYNNQTSAPVPFIIVANNVHIYTVNSSGVGPAVATFPDGFISPTNSARENEIVVFWANGLGPVSFAENVAALGGDMTALPLEVYIGGKQATILYRGRNACCSSVDTVYVRMPSGLSGCAVPVSMRIGAYVSNTATIPVATTGRTCAPVVSGYSQSEVERLLTKPSLSVGNVSVTRTSTTSSVSVGPVPPVPTVSRGDIGGGSFFLYNAPGQVVFTTQTDVPPFGSCKVVSFSGQDPPAQIGLASTSLDAGGTLTVSGPNGNRVLNKNIALGGAISYGATLGAGTAGNYLDAGSYTISGQGGGQVGTFTAGIVLPAPLNWTNQSVITTVTRGGGVTVNWSGGGTNSLIQITGVSTTIFGGLTTGAAFYCTARAADRTFTVPNYVLLALPQTTTAPGSVPGTLSVNSFNTAPFSAGGLDVATITATEAITQTVTYQ